MTAFFQVFLISVSLAMDCFSVATGGGMKAQKSKIAYALRVALFFGLFQAIMPIFGWGLGQFLEAIIKSIDHWIAFILLTIVGIKMIKESMEKDENKTNILQLKTLFMLSIATSIDAFVIGITLHLFKVPFYVSIITIGITTFILSFLGFLFGKKLKNIFGRRIEILGGIILIAIGLKILLEHLLI